ncbi:unnamed protein product, partial [Mesorhabditis belari]|uniref:Malate dehydrogenase n=1 Tax=Mesorhabditis belari TaxID=2138241 RepID=A0AAF3F4F3_9BILA
MAQHGERVVPKNEMNRFMMDCLCKVGAEESHAKQLAEVLIEGDYRGHFSHGLNRLDMYVHDFEKHLCRPSGEPIILKEKAGTAWVDGNNLLGPVVGNFCIDLAIKKAKEAGVGWVVAKGSNHFGIAGWYSMRALKEGMMGLSFTNTSPIMFPTRAAKAALGTNPLSLAAPGNGCDSFVLDMATTTVAVGKIEIAARKEMKVPESWGVSEGGATSTDPEKILRGGGLLPVGGAELSGGYKGYGMAALVEIFCGILGGAKWGPNVRKWMSASEDANLGQCFIAVDPEAFAPGFTDRMQELMDTLRSLPEAEVGNSVEVAGDVERRHTVLCDRLGGIPYHPNQIKFANDLAERLGVEKPRILSEL